MTTTGFDWRHLVASSARGRKNELARAILGLADGVERIGEDLAAEDRDWTAWASESIRRWGVHIEGAEVTDLIDEVQAAATRRPALLIAGAFAVGFVASRLLQEPSERPSSSRWEVSDR